MTDLLDTGSGFGNYDNNNVANDMCNQGKEPRGPEKAMHGMQHILSALKL